MTVDSDVVNKSVHANQVNKTKGRQTHIGKEKQGELVVVVKTLISM